MKPRFVRFMSALKSPRTRNANAPLAKWSKSLMCSPWCSPRISNLRHSDEKHSDAKSLSTIFIKLVVIRLKCIQIRGCLCLVGMCQGQRKCVKHRQLSRVSQHKVFENLAFFHQPIFGYFIVFIRLRAANNKRFKGGVWVRLWSLDYRTVCLCARTNILKSIL